MKYFYVTLCLLLLTSCALKPILPDDSFKTEIIDNVTLEDLGKGKVLFYNGADALHKIDNTGRLNIWINGKPLGQLRPRQYVIVQLEQGNYNLDLLHIDLVNMRSKHQLRVVDSVKVVKLKPTTTSNKLEVVNEFPRVFEKYTPIY